MNRTKIPWADYTWNPIEGCSPASEGCQNCYAAAMARRFHRPWGAPVFHPEKLDEPMRVKKPSRVFVCSTSDLFHEDVKEKWVEEVFSVMRHTPRHTFLFLTKRPSVGRTLMDTLIGGRLPPNVFPGITAENQARYDERWPVLAGIPASVRFVSVEPMLGPVTIMAPSPGKPDWVICGPETGPKKRPFNSEWLHDLASECSSYFLPFFDKRNQHQSGFTRRQFPEVPHDY